MDKISNEMVEEAKAYVFDLLKSKVSSELLYHSYDHTIDVLQNAELIGKYSGLNDDDLNTLMISTIFHDIGFVGIYDGHEKVSVDYAREFLSERNINRKIIDQVSDAIMATKVPQSPNDLISMVLCDADLMYLSDERNLLNDIELLRKEWIYFKKGDYSKKEFYKVTLNFFEQHHYHTKYGIEKLEPKKEMNKKLLLEKIRNN